MRPAARRAWNSRYSIGASLKSQPSCAGAPKADFLIEAWTGLTESALKNPHRPPD